ncbi:Ribonuclease [Candidatus Saccharibacteria bacterium RAAC3_TM7_1]|nr:Ribonuclease [Candidatus Saccharibacteria bacterium RAAC3_TM7_1]
MILGIDEVGRGPWAGPLVVGAVVLGCDIDGLTDSKKLSAKRRTELALEIREKAAGVGLGWVRADEIDTLGLSQALALACQRAVQAVDTLGVAYHEIILDGTVNFLKDTPKGRYVTTLKKADLLIAAVSAASIVAKVARDEYMVQQAELYPDYGFASHVGYGTAIHRAAIEKYGVTPLHRLSFAPLAKYNKRIKPASTQTVAASERHSSKEIGDAAETLVTDELRKRGYEVLARNWKTKFCEIDIVARKNDTVYFVEVKHRKNIVRGGGLAAITAKKLRQMKFAAEAYLTRFAPEANALLMVATTVGVSPVIEELLEIE